MTFYTVTVNLHLLISDYFGLKQFGWTTQIWILAATMSVLVPQGPFLFFFEHWVSSAGRESVRCYLWRCVGAHCPHLGKYRTADFIKQQNITIEMAVNVIMMPEGYMWGFLWSNQKHCNSWRLAVYFRALILGIFDKLKYLVLVYTASRCWDFDKRSSAAFHFALEYSVPST